MKPPSPGLPPIRPPEPPPVQRLIVRTGVVGTARFLSHLETMNAWLRTLRRAQVPLVYSQGFHPHPKVAFSSARPVAEASFGEYMDITLNRRVDPAELSDKLAKLVPHGFRVFGVKEVPIKTPSLTSLISTQVSVRTSMTTTFPMSVRTAMEMASQMTQTRIQTVTKMASQIPATT